MRHAGRTSNGKRAAQRAPQVSGRSRIVDPWLNLTNPLNTFDIRTRAAFDPPESLERRSSLLQQKLREGGVPPVTLADKMRDCYEEEPCGFAGCPKCGRTWRINWCWRAAEAIDAAISGSVTVAQPIRRDIRGAQVPVTFVTLAHPIDQYAIGDLHRFSVKRFRDRLRTTVIRAGLGHVQILGAADFSNNLHIAGAWPEHWQVHFHGVVVGADRTRVKNALSPFYPKTETIPRGVKTSVVHDTLGVLSYSYKLAFFRRVSVIDSRGHRNTLKPQPIPGPQLRELMTTLGTMTFANRLFLRGFRRRGAVLVREPTANG